MQSQLAPDNESGTQKFLLFLRSMGSVLIGFLMAYEGYQLIHSVTKGTLANANCDAQCSYTLEMATVVIFLPFFFLIMWASFSYVIEILIQKKLKSVPKRGLGIGSLFILLAGVPNYYFRVPKSEISIGYYIKVAGDWREGHLSEQSKEAFKTALKNSTKK